MNKKKDTPDKDCGPRCEKLESKPGCIQSALRVVGDKWTPFLIARLIDAPRTFLELEELLPGISPRTLSQRLKKLEEEDVLIKKLYEKRPQRFNYALTNKGKELTTLLLQMAKWGEKYR